MTTRALSRDTYLALRAKVRDLIRDNGGLVPSSEATRLSKSTLGRCQTPHDDDWMPVDVVADLEAQAGEPVVTRFLAGLLGYRLVPDEDAAAPVAEPLSVDLVLQMGAAAAAGVGQFCGYAMTAAQDGRITDAELAQLVAQAEANMREAERTHDDLCRLSAARRDSVRFVPRSVA